MEIDISGKKIIVYRTEPSSSVSDYDYGDNCRYISSYNNHFEIYSDIVNIKIADITMPDDTVESIVGILEELSDNLGIDHNSDGIYNNISITIPPTNLNINNTITFHFSRMSDGKLEFYITITKPAPYPTYQIIFQVFMNELEVLSLHQTLCLLMEEYPSV